VDEILGPTTSFYFSVKPADGVAPDGFKEGQVFYLSPEDLLPMDRFNKGSEGNKGSRPPPGQKFQRGGFNKPGGPPFRGRPAQGKFIQKK
jgi:H/ACA ribonucleoprotein complex subunit 1